MSLPLSMHRSSCCNLDLHANLPNSEIFCARLKWPAIRQPLKSCMEDLFWSLPSPSFFPVFIWRVPAAPPLAIHRLHFAGRRASISLRDLLRTMTSKSSPPPTNSMTKKYQFSVLESENRNPKAASVRKAGFAKWQLKQSSAATCWFTPRLHVFYK